MMAYMGLPLDLFGNVCHCILRVVSHVNSCFFDVGRFFPAVFTVTAA